MKEDTRVSDDVSAEPDDEYGVATSVADETPSETTATVDEVRPDYVPEKFWDAGAGAVRVEMLAKSYAELERRFSARMAEPEPETGPDDAREGDPPDGDLFESGPYEIDTSHGLFEPAPELDAVLQDAGFTGEQAQLVYDLAAHVLAPVLSAVEPGRDAEVEETRLAQHFGGGERWGEMRRQLRVWGKRHLPADVYDTLSSTYDGVLSLHRLMHAEEPSVLRGGGAADHVVEASLRRMIRDPRYWRDRDVSVIRQVSEGFNRLYPGGS